MPTYKIKLVRRVEIEIKHDAPSAQAVKHWVKMWDLQDLQHEGEIVSDEVKVRGITF